jgi:hypothetical protein
LKKRTLGIQHTLQMFLVAWLRAATRSEVEHEMHDANEFHFEGLRAAGEEIPQSRSGKIMETVKKLLRAVLSWPVRLFPNSPSFPTKRSG